jgi:hypothetical protein
MRWTKEQIEALGEEERKRMNATQADEAVNAKAPKPKTLHNSDVAGARVNVPDIKVVGNGDSWKLLCKASSQEEGWMKSTKAMEVPGGCLVQVTTQQRNPDGSYVVAEAVCFVPGVTVVNDENNGRRLTGSG